MSTTTKTVKLNDKQKKNCTNVSSVGKRRATRSQLGSQLRLQLLLLRRQFRLQFARLLAFCWLFLLIVDFGSGGGGGGLILSVLETRRRGTGRPARLA